MTHLTDQALRRNNFGLFRLTLASLVVLSHSFALTLGSNRDEPLARFTHGQLTFGELAVNWFFVISGFLIMMSWSNSRGLVGFLRKRVLRIYPAYLVAVLVCVTIIPLLCGSRHMFPTTLDPSELWKALVLRAELPDFFLYNPSRTTNGSLWSISFEFWCYLGVALLGLLGVARRPWIIPGLIAVLVGSYITLMHIGWRPGGTLLGVVLGSPFIWTRMAPFFLSGVLFFQWRRRIPLSARVAVLCVCGLVLAAALPPYGLAITMPILGTYVVFCAAFSDKFCWPTFGSRVDVSYGTYLYAFPIQQLWIYALAIRSPFLLFSLALPSSLLAGYLSWHGVERHFLQLKQPLSAVAPCVPDPATISNRPQ